MAINEQLKKFSKQQISVLVFSAANTILAIACAIWAVVLFKKKNDKTHEELVSKIHLVVLSGTAILGQIFGFYGVFKENLFSSILFGCLVSFHLGVDFILGFTDMLFWIGSGFDLFGIVVIIVYAWELNGKYFMNYRRNLGANKA